MPLSFPCAAILNYVTFIRLRLFNVKDFVLPGNGCNCITSRMKSKIAMRGKVHGKIIIIIIEISLELPLHSFPLQNLNSGIGYIVDSIQSVVLFSADISSFASQIVYPVFLGGVLWCTTL